MGSKISKTKAAHITKDKQAMVKKATKNQLQQCKQQLNTVQQEILASPNGNAEQKAQIMMVTDKAMVQLERDDKPFTKNDLIAILVALGSVPLRDMETLESSTTVPELHSLIRGQIYDVGKMMQGHGPGPGGRIENSMQGRIETPMQGRIENRQTYAIRN